MQCWFLYKEFETKGQKCPVSQITDLHFTRLRWVRDWNAREWNENRPFPRIRCLASDQPPRRNKQKFLISWLFIFTVYHFGIVLYIRKALKNRRDKLYIVKGFQELVSQNTYRFSNLHILHFSCFIPCFRLSHGGNGLLWHWIHFSSGLFISFLFVLLRFASQNTVIQDWK